MKFESRSMRGWAGARRQQGSIMVEYVIATLFVGLVVWAAIMGISYDTPDGRTVELLPSLLQAMQSEYHAYTDVISSEQ